MLRAGGYAYDRTVNTNVITARKTAAKYRLMSNEITRFVVFPSFSVDAFPEYFDQTEALAALAEWKQLIEEQGNQVTVAGRYFGRLMGISIMLEIEDYATGG